MLQSAVWHEQRVALTYRRGDGACVERVVDPLGRVAKGSIWYLVAAVDGATIEMTLTFDGEPDACAFALSHGTSLEVLEPPSLRNQVAETAAAVADRYGAPRSSRARQSPRSRRMS